MVGSGTQAAGEEAERLEELLRQATRLELRVTRSLALAGAVASDELRRLELAVASDEAMGEDAAGDDEAMETGDDSSNSSGLAILFEQWRISGGAELDAGGPQAVLGAGGPEAVVGAGGAGGPEADAEAVATAATAQGATATAVTAQATAVTVVATATAVTAQGARRPVATAAAIATAAAKTVTSGHLVRAVADFWWR